MEGKRERKCYMGESENEDDPFQSSGEEWDFEKAKREESGRGRGRKCSIRLSRRSRKLSLDTDGTDTEKKSRKRNGSTKKRKLKPEPEPEPEDDVVIIPDGDGDEIPVKQEKIESPVIVPEPPVPESPKIDVPSFAGFTMRPAHLTNPRPISRKYIPKTIYSEEYATGSFVILKKDAQWGDPKKHPCIWRIDGKALLQKYEAFDEDGKVRHRNTSVYTGWSPLDKDIYAPVTVDVVKHVNSNLIVELHWDKLQTINIDSD